MSLRPRCSAITRYVKVWALAVLSLGWLACEPSVARTALDWGVVTPPDAGVHSDAHLDRGVDADGATDGAADGAAGPDAPTGEPCGNACDPFSIVLLPDTQYYTSKQPNNAQNSYRKQMQWIIDHRQSDDIRFVLHLGDMTNNNTIAQWQTASDAHAMLDTAGIPYSVAAGNHDYLGSAGFDRGGSRMNDYFPPSRFSGHPGYGGAFRGSSTNNYAFFAHGNQQFLVISLEFAPRKDALCWASDLIASHPKHHVIIVTHCYLTHGGTYANCPASYDAIGASGASLWAELISNHSNVFLVVSGHVDDSEFRTRTSNTGVGVHEMLVDYQFEGECGASSASKCTDNCQAGTYHGNGWMRQLVFDPRKGTIEARTFSVEAGNTKMFPGGKPALFCSELRDPSSSSSGANWYPSDPADPTHHYTFSYDFVAPPAVGIDFKGKTSFVDRTVNSAGAGTQIAPVVAMAQSGAFVVAWQDDSDASDGAGNHDIFLRGFAVGGCQAFADLRVNTDPTGHQASPAVAMDAQGNFVVAWEDDTDGNGVYQIKARGFNANGTERFAAFTVNATAAGQQTAPAIAMAQSGDFVVVWQDDPANNDHDQIRMRGFFANGTQRFADRSVHADALGQRIAPDVGLDANGNIVVVWQDDTDENGAYQIHARGFWANGSDGFARITVNSVATGQQRDPVVAVATDGRFVVAWRDDQNNDGNHQIFVRGFDAAGAQRFADLAVSSASGEHRDPALACTAQGDFTVSWSDDSDGNGSYQLHAARYAANGSAKQADFTVNTISTGQQFHPGAAVNATGALVIAWADDIDGNGVFQILARGY